MPRDFSAQATMTGIWRRQSRRHHKPNRATQTASVMHLASPNQKSTISSWHKYPRGEAPKALGGCPPNLGIQQPFTQMFHP